ncbi:MAG: aspartyl protease family protein [Brevundimonas sp.]|jgi:predicted aspartyl protease|uniref:aspartyl protease family protein n=1 Tax=Brevundimonas sp. TaxID=1871086 RepID=UPI001A1C4BB6|nr:aspartyl protease family protein [Brevundimonas sp.]MBJ7318015.1 aspartyl protease family protein [Brevundimonas sp.]
MASVWISSAAVCAVFIASAAVAQTPEREAFRSDPTALRAAVARDGSDRLSEGLLAAYEFRDAEARTVLKTYLTGAPTSEPDRNQALAALSGVLLRDGLYGEAAEAMSRLLETSETEDEVRATTQSLAVARALADTPPQARIAFAAGAVAIERDAARLARIPLEVNGSARRFVLDTGANFSVVTESEAAALGLRILGDTAGVGSITQAGAVSRIGVADEVKIGAVVFQHVVFLIMPDASLTFAGGAYSIPGIVGFPVISRLERLEVAKGADGAETLSWGPSGPTPVVRDLYVDGLTPRVYVRVGGGEPVPFAFDTGANRTTLRPALLDERPDLAAGAVASREQVGGAGGVRTVEARRAPVVELRIDDVGVRLTDVSAADEHAGGDMIRGRLGQDVLSQGYVMDFPAGDFQLKRTP